MKIGEHLNRVIFTGYKNIEIRKKIRRLRLYFSQYGFGIDLQDFLSYIMF